MHGVLPAQIKDVPAAIKWLKANMSTPRKDLSAKKGVGIYRRVFHHVPLKAR